MDEPPLLLVTLEAVEQTFHAEAQRDLVGAPRVRVLGLEPELVDGPDAEAEWGRADHPREVSVVQVVPSQLRLSFDTRLSREVEVHPRVTGNFASGDQIVRIDADPPRITITGPRHHVEKIDAAITDPIDASGTLGSAVFTTNAYVPDPLVQVSQGTSIRVTVVVQKVGTPTTH